MKTKKLGNYAMSVLSLVLAVMMFSSCDSQRKEIEQMLLKSNDDCPIEVGDIGTITSMTLEDDVVLINGVIEENEYVTLDALSNNKEIFGVTLMTSLEPDFLEKVADAGYTIKYVCKAKGTNQSITYRLDSDGLKNMLAKNYTEADLARGLLKSVMKIIKQNTVPSKIDKGLTITDVYLEGSDAVYVLSMDETLYDIEILSDNIENARASIIESLSAQSKTAEGKPFFDMLRKADGDIIYRYVGETSGNSCDVKIELDEL